MKDSCVENLSDKFLVECLAIPLQLTITWCGSNFAIFAVFILSEDTLGNFNFNLYQNVKFKDIKLLK